MSVQLNVYPFCLKGKTMSCSWVYIEQQTHGNPWPYTEVWLYLRSDQNAIHMWHSNCIWKITPNNFEYHTKVKSIRNYMFVYFCHILLNLVLTGRWPQGASVRYLVLQFSHLLQAPLQSIEENSTQLSFTEIYKHIHTDIYIVISRV